MNFVVWPNREPLIANIIFSFVTLLVLFDSVTTNAQSQDNLARLRQDRFESSLSDGGKCQPLAISFCDGVNYNYTMMPNFVSHQTQQDATTDIAQYSPLLKVNCSPDIQMFLCSMFAPICFPDQENPPIMKPCKSLCISAKSGCESIMKRFGFTWPSQLDCTDLPVQGNGTICVGRNTSEVPESFNVQRDTHGVNGAPQHSYIGMRDLSFVCPENFKVPPDHHSYIFKLNGKSYKNCGTPCDDVLLSKKDTALVRQLTGILAILCVLSTSFTCLTFLLNTQRFIYPERPIIIISFCMLLVGICYTIGYIIGDQAVCNEPFEAPRAISNVKMVRTIVKGNKKEICTLLFMTAYFFNTATYFWWLMLAVSWFMSAGLKWTYEFVESVSHYFHLISWSISALLTITILVKGEIEGDVNSGICFVGLWNSDTFFSFVMIPMSVCLGFGVIFLLAGYRSLWSIRSIMKLDGTPTYRLEKLMLRIGVFSLLFFIPSVIQLIFYHYEQTNMNSWLLTWLSELCKNREYSIPCPKLTGLTPPHYLIFITKYLAIMFFGIVSGFIVISRKTSQAYGDLYEMFCCSRDEQPRSTNTDRISHNQKDNINEFGPIPHGTCYRSVYSGDDGPLSRYPYKLT